MAEFHPEQRPEFHPQQRPQDPHQKQQESHPVVKAVATATAGGSLMVLSGLTLAGTVIALTVATPLLVIFSPILVPAGITVCLVVVGFLTSGGLGVAALSVLAWMYKYLTEKHPPGADQMDDARKRLAAKAREMEETSQKGVEQATQSHS